MWVRENIWRERLIVKRSYQYPLFWWILPDISKCMLLKKHPAPNRMPAWSQFIFLWHCYSVIVYLKFTILCVSYCVLSSLDFGKSQFIYSMKPRIRVRVINSRWRLKGWGSKILRLVIFAGICLTTDVDTLLFHMNNTRYLREVDFARADFYVRARLWSEIKRRGGSVAQICTNIRYRRFIRPFCFYTITTRVSSCKRFNIIWSENLGI